MFKISHKIILETMVVFILIIISITSFYATFLPDTKFLFFEETYLELLALTETGGNGKLNLLTYPLGLYFICIFTCVQYLRSRNILYINFLILIWSAVLLARIISIILRGGIVFDIYFLVGIFPEFIIAPFFFFLRNKVFNI